MCQIIIHVLCTPFEYYSKNLGSSVLIIEISILVSKRYIKKIGLVKKTPSYFKSCAKVNLVAYNNKLEVLLWSITGGSVN